MNGRTLFFISVAINVLLLIALFKSCNETTPCDERIVERHWVDTIRIPIEKIQPDIRNTKPQLVTVKKYKGQPLLPSLVCQTDSPAQSGASVTCLDTAIYTDHVCKDDDYELQITDTVAGNQLIGRRLVFYNLKPMLVYHHEKTVYQREKERIRLYAGAFTGIQFSYTGRNVTDWTIGPQLLLTEPHGLAFIYGFDAKHNGHNIGLFYKIKVGK